MTNGMDDLFLKLFNTIKQQQELLASISEKLNNLEMGKGMATITDYVPGTVYKRNMLIVDPVTETVYRSVADPEFTSITVETDCANGNLKLVGFESQIVTFDHEPSQLEINTIPDGTMVAIYSASDTPYEPSSSE